MDGGGAPGHHETEHGRRGARLRRWSGGGGVGHGWGARGGGAGEERGCLGGSGERERLIHDVTGRGERRGGGQVCGVHVVLAAEHLPACLAGKQLAGAALGWAGRWAGSRRQVSFFHFFLFSVFLIFYKPYMIKS